MVRKPLNLTVHLKKSKRRLPQFLKEKLYNLLLENIIYLLIINFIAKTGGFDKRQINDYSKNTKYKYAIIYTS